MKTRMMKNIYILTIILLVVSNSMFSQAKCNKSLFGNFDYRSQSKYALLLPGDTSKLNIVAYANQQFRVFVCSDPELGDVSFKVIERTRRSEKKIKEIKKQEKEQYKRDANGEIEYLESNAWQPTVIGKEVTLDTIWETKRFDEDKILFDSRSNKNESGYWQFEAKKTQRFIIEVVVPKGNREEKGEVEINVGRKSLGSKSFTIN